MHTRIAIVAALALGCAGSPEEAFVGRFSGSYECSGRFDDGSPYTEGPLDHVMAIDRALDGSIFIAGSGCTIPLRVVSTTRAEIVRTDCDVTLPTGAEVRVTYESGILMLDEPRLSSRQSSRVDARDGSWSLTASCDYSLTRSE